jgi:hypothetical protein
VPYLDPESKSRAEALAQAEVVVGKGKEVPLKPKENGASKVEAAAT